MYVGARSNEEQWRECNTPGRRKLMCQMIDLIRQHDHVQQQTEERLELWRRWDLWFLAGIGYLWCHKSFAVRYIASSVVTAEGKRLELSDFPSPFPSIVSSKNRYERVASNLNVVLTCADKGKPHLCSHQQKPKYNIIRCTIFRVGRRAKEGNNWSFFWI